jgi:pimeloyl-ACP methyl ester carboxylesterase
MDNRLIPPPGKMVEAGGSRFHVRTFGDAHRPALLCEAGLLFMSSCWGWLAPLLARSFFVITYDRAGLGWSEAREGVRDAAAIAQELDALLRKIEPVRRMVLLGHSMGAIFNRAFARIRPERVSALVWLDPAHPDQMNHSELRRRMRAMFFFISAARMLAEKNLPQLALPLARAAAALPRGDARSLRKFLRDPKHLAASMREARHWNDSAALVRADPLPPVPLLVISGGRHALPGWRKMQESLISLREHAQHHTIREASHFDLILQKRFAEECAALIESFPGFTRK